MKKKTQVRIGQRHIHVYFRHCSFPQSSRWFFVVKSFSTTARLFTVGLLPGFSLQFPLTIRETGVPPGRHVLDLPRPTGKGCTRDSIQFFGTSTVFTSVSHILNLTYAKKIHLNSTYFNLNSPDQIVIKSI